MIQADNIFHHYGSKAVLNGPSIEVSRGEIVVIMGPNGMGKSTLLACLGGVQPPQGGRVLIDGEPRYQDEAIELRIREKVVYLPDSPWAPPARTCRQWAVAVGLLYRTDERFVLQHVDALINLFEMEKVADSPIESYSAGQKKKASLITALAPDTPILIMDEPFSGGLDPTGLFAIKRVLTLRARKKNNAVLIATPTPELVEEVADRIVILRDGTIPAQGTLQELRQLSGTAESLEAVYERLSSSHFMERLQNYEETFML